MGFSTTYQPLPISFTHGKGVWLYDENGDAYLDSFAGIGVSILGHSHPTIVSAIQEQAAKLLHVSNGFLIPEQDNLAKKIMQITGMQQIFFANSGAEANEAAIKLTRLFAHKHNVENPEIIVMERAFHGRTMATLSASANRKIQAGYEPFFPGFIRVPFNDISAIQTIAKHHNNIVAVLLEPIQGEGGIYCADTEYLQQLRTICDQQDWLLVFDEVQSGNGRTGDWFAFMHYGVTPDILTTAKGPIHKAIQNNHCQRAVLVGHNAWFDLLFINAAVRRNKLKSPFHAFTSFDTATLSGLIFGQTVLSKACEAANIVFDSNEAHSAIYDAQKTAELFCYMLNHFESLGG